MVGGVRASQWGLVANSLLAIAKLLAGIVGNSYALVADAIESASDVFSSLIVWSGIRLSARDPDEEFRYGYGKAETLSGLVVGLMLLAAAAAIAIQSAREIVTPHHTPAPFTLAVLVGVVVVKETLFRRVFRVGEEVQSVAVVADAWHHRSDAITSLAAFVGIAVAIFGGPGWESADDWAALAAAGIIVWNGVRILRRAARDLLDATPDPVLVESIAKAVSPVPGVRSFEKLRVRRVGLSIEVDLHVRADPLMALRDSHELGHAVAAAIRAAVPAARTVLVHMEPQEG